MQITSTHTPHTTGNLKPFVVQEGERLSFHTHRPSKLRNGVNMWFSGKYNHIRNIYIHSMTFDRLGNVSDSDMKAIQKMMLKGKTEILTDGINYYTFYGDWCKITNMYNYTEINKNILERA